MNGSKAQAPQVKTIKSVAKGKAGKYMPNLKARNPLTFMEEFNNLIPESDLDFSNTSQLSKAKTIFKKQR